MSQTKAIIDFSDYTAAELGPIAQHIHDQMTAHAADFSAPPVTMAALQTLVTTYTTALVDRASNATADILALAQARAALEDALGKLGYYANTQADGDAVMVDKSGFPAYTTGGAADPSPPDAPENLRLRHGKVSGAITALYKPKRRASTNEVQTTTGDPNVDAGWETRGLYQRGRADLTGLTPGTLYWVRVRTVGLRGVMGAWSDPAQIRVL